MRTSKKTTFAGLVARFRSWIAQERNVRFVLAGAIFLFIVYFTYVAFLRHDNYFSLRLDLGNMDQTVWNVLRGHGFTLTDPMGSVQESRLAVHADFLLILLAPLYRIWSNPKMLLVLQVGVLALGAVPIYWLAKKVLRNSQLGLLLSIGYLLYPTVQLNALHDFHATSLASTFLLLAFWYFVVEKPIPFIIFSLLAALGKEQFWVISAMLGLLWVSKPRYRLMGIGMAIGSLVMFYLLFWKFMPAVTPTRHYWALAYFSEFGGSMDEILQNLLKHPWQAFSSAFAPDRLFYYFQLFSPTAFLSLLAPWTLMLAFPNLAINVLSNNPLMRMIDYQYTSGITPWIFISSIYGFAVLKKRARNVIVVFLIVCMVTAVYFWGELPYGPHSRFWFFHTIQPEKAAIDTIATSVPQEKSVSVTNNIGAHFSQRQFLYNFPIKADSADYIVVLLGDQYAFPSGEEQERILQLVLADTKYELIAHVEDFYAFKRKSL